MLILLLLCYYRSIYRKNLEYDC